MVMITLYAKQKKRHRCNRTDFGTLLEKARVECSERTALKQVYYQGWNSRCRRQMLRAGALGRPRGMGWEGRWKGGSGSGTHVNPWLIHVNIWQKPLQYCKVISLQLIKIHGKKSKNKFYSCSHHLQWFWSPSKIKSLTVSTVFPSICHEVMWPDAMILVFWILNFKPAFSLSCFNFIKRIFSSSSLSDVSVVSYAYLIAVSPGNLDSKEGRLGYVFFRWIITSILIITNKKGEIAFCVHI